MVVVGKIMHRTLAQKSRDMTATNGRLITFTTITESSYTAQICFAKEKLHALAHTIHTHTLSDTRTRTHTE